MITNKNNTPSTIYLKEDEQGNFYEKDLDDSLPGVVKYVREDYIPNDSEMIEFAKSQSFYLDDRLTPYDRDNLRAMAWLDGYRFAKRNTEMLDEIMDEMRTASEYVHKHNLYPTGWSNIMRTYNELKQQEEQQKQQSIEVPEAPKPSTPNKSTRKRSL